MWRLIPYTIMVGSMHVLVSPVTVRGGQSARVTITSRSGVYLFGAVQ